MFRKSSFFLAFIFSVAGSFLFHETRAAQQNNYKDTVWVPVIFYDYWVDANGTNPDFEIAPAAVVSGMVYDTLDNQKKPVPTPVACPTPPTSAPAACHLSEWYRVSGASGSDQSCIFTTDSLNPAKRIWTTSSGGPLTPYGTVNGDFVGPNYNAAYNMRNVIIYDSIPFIHLGKNNPALLGIYEINNTRFFPLDNRGFGIQPAGSSHNFGFAMELHTTFSFRKGLNFTFAGDDDCWVFVNGKKVVDLGGRHSAETGSVDLDTMSGLIEGNIYNLDFFYAERHTIGSDIRITSNMIAPANIGIDVFPSATIYPGDTARITGTLLDGSGNPFPGNLSDSITWSIDPATQKTGDVLLVNKGKITRVIAGPTTDIRTITVIGTYGKTDVIVGKVQITILPAIPKAIVIYNNDLAPPVPSAKMADPSQLIPIAAGTPFLLVGNVFDKYSQWLSQYRIAPGQNKISWEAKDRAGSLNNKLDALTGAAIHFAPTQAYDTVMVIATLHIDSINVLMDTVQFDVGPGKEKHLVIEPKGILNRLHENPLDTLFIMEGENFNSVYTTVRDSFGNFIRYGSISAWGSLDNTIVTVANGDISFGEGIVNRVITATDSITKITAVDTNALLKPDTANVKLVKYYFTNLRIVIGTNTNPTDLTMNTNQDTTLTVQGRRSNDGVWVDVSANWHNSANLKIDPTAPTSHSWRFSPLDTGTGIIFVTLDNDKTIPDTLPAFFTPGPPVRATIELITPRAEIIAGYPIQAVVRVYDKDGNSYTYKFDTAAYHDLLGTGGATFPEPFIIIDNKRVVLYGSPWDFGSQTFTNGRDTVSFTLYNAPLDTTKLHQIFTNLIIGTDTIKASSTPFVLHPDKLAEIRIEYPNGTPLPDTLTLSDFILLYSRGYDKYGNPYGEIIGNWTVTDSLHAIQGTTNGSNISYDPNVKRDERGFIIVDHNGIRDSLYVIIKGPMITLVSAITRDVSGNGILDRIELHFSRDFELPANASFPGMTVIANSKNNLIVNKILNTGNGKNDSIWIVDLVESDTSLPQTAWTPVITLPQQSPYSIGASTVTATDGAGPVVWRVVNNFVVANDHRYDTVVVTFSEPVQRWDGDGLNPSDRPVDIFYVWQKDTNNAGHFLLVRDMFAGINNLNRDPGKSNTLTFTMSNGNDLNRGYYLSIADSTRRYLSDIQSFPANLNNNPRRVAIGLILGPIFVTNPIRPIFKHDGPGVFPIVNRPESKDWPVQDHGGAIIKVSFPTLPIEEANAKLKFTIKIYDLIGNIVQSGKEDDFLHKDGKYDKNDLENQSAADAIIYWNGANAKGMAAAPGIYRAVVYLQYTGVSNANRSKFRDMRFIAKLGIQR